MASFKMCMCFTKKFKVNEFQIPFDIREAFSRFTDGGTLMSSEQLLRFLVEYQGEIAATESDAEQIIHQVMHRRHRIVSLVKHAMTTEDFLHYLLAEDLNPLLEKEVHNDMTAPLSHYFIYTGHNSYLTGNQLSSDCSDAPIIKALMRGVRVIELDLWPNSTKDNVQVLHGRTLTSPVSLIKCLKSIKEYAFEASPYPVILTLEDHLTPDLQAKVAEMVTQTFGDMLYCPKTEIVDEFPSPEGLKYRIVLSTKPPKEYLEDKTLKERDSSGDDTCSSEFSEAREDFLSDGELSDNVQDEEENTETCRKSGQSGAHKYKWLIAIPAKKKKGGLKASLTVDPLCVRRLSLSEQKLLKAKSRHGTDVVRFTQRNLLRVYPKGTRFDSSNYNPLVSWMHGAQMVAFNMQGYGRALWLMHGMFRANGGCGYVKKPDILLDSSYIFDPKAVLPVKKTLKVVVYMGDGWRVDFEETHFDTYSPPDFYVKVAVAGVPSDTVKHKTQVIENDWTPVWDKEFWFPLTVPELALLRIEVHEHDRSEKDDFGGQTVLPVWELRRGIRTVPLFTRKGDKFRSVKLLMQFQFV